MYRKCLFLSCVMIATGYFVATSADEKPAESKQVTSVRLKEGTWKDVESLIARNKGKVVIVDAWSTACMPCMKEFPNLLKLQKRYTDQLVSVSMNVDYIGIKSKPPEYYRPRVEKFLNAQKSTIHNFLSTTDSDTFFTEQELSSIPAVYVYGKDGKLAKRFDSSMAKPGAEEPFTYKHDINPFVAELISK